MNTQQEPLPHHFHNHHTEILKNLDPNIVTVHHERKTQVNKIQKVYVTQSAVRKCISQPTNFECPSKSLRYAGSFQIHITCYANIYPNTKKEAHAIMKYQLKILARIYRSGALCIQNRFRVCFFTFIRDKN